MKFFVSCQERPHPQVLSAILREAVVVRSSLKVGTQMTRAPLTSGCQHTLRLIYMDTRWLSFPK